MSIRWVACALLMWIGLAVAAVAGDLDRYRYVLEENKNDKVCRHMQEVYNKYFSYPWKRPGLTTRSDDAAYGPNGRYAFPKLPGVTHDNRMTLDMSYSRLPTGPEFEAIDWREGRFRHTGLSGSPDYGDRPMLVAEFDIDNDGRVETVIKQSFMLTYVPAGRRTVGGRTGSSSLRRGRLTRARPLQLSCFTSVS